jgi:hypothetical protein
VKRKNWLVLGFSFIAFLILFIFAKAEIQRNLNVKAIETVLSQRSGLAVSAKSVTLAWNGNLVLHDVVVSKDKLPFLTAEQVKIHLSWWNLVFKKVVLDSVTLVHPSLILNHNLMQELMQKMKRSVSRLPSFPLYVEKGEFSYASIKTGKEISFENVQGLFFLSSGRALISLHFSGSQGGNFRLKGSVGKNGVHLFIDATNVPFSSVMNPFGEASSASLSGTISCSFEVKGIFPQLALNGSALIRNPLFKGGLSIVGNFSKGSSGIVFRGKVSSSQGQLVGIGAFKALSFGICLSPRGVSFQHGFLLLSFGNIAFSGDVGAKNKLNLFLQSRDLHLSANKTPASFQVSATGIFPNLNLLGSVQIPQIQVADRILKDICVVFNGRSTAQNVSFQKFVISANGASIPLNAHLGWDKNGVLALSFQQLNAESVASILGFGNLLQPLKMILFGKLIYASFSKSIRADIGADQGEIGRFFFDAFYADFSFSRKEVLDFTSSFQRNGKFLSFHVVLHKSGAFNASFSFPRSKSPLLFSGYFNRQTKKINLEGDLKGEDPGFVLSMFEPNLPPMGGSIYGKLAVSGIYPNLSVSFSGEVQNAFFQNITIPTGKLLVHGELPRVSLQFHTDQFSLASLEFLTQFIPMNGTGSLDIATHGSFGHFSILFHFPNVSFNGKPVGAFIGSMQYHSGILEVKQLALPFLSPPLIFSGALNAHTRSVNFDVDFMGQKVSNLATLLGKSEFSVDGNLYGRGSLKGVLPKIRFEFLGKIDNLSFNKMSLGKAALHAEAFPSENGFNLNADIEGLSLASFSSLQKVLPGLTGGLSLDFLKSEKGDEVSFHTANAFLKGKKFPDVSGQLLLKLPWVQVMALDVTLHPPLSLLGSINTTSQGVQLSGELQGQEIADLMLLAGSSSNGINGNLNGPLKIDGTFDAPVVHFNGKVDHLRYRDITLGSGKLVVVESKNSINGKLLLDKPIYLGANRSLIGSLLSSIPGGVGSAYRQYAKNEAIVGALIGGNPKNLKISLMMQNVGRSQQTQEKGQNNPINSILQQLLQGK